MQGDFHCDFDEDKSNFFEINEFLLILKDRVRLQDISKTWGLTAESRAEYEIKHKLPRGIFDFVMLMQDKKFSTLVEELQTELSQIQPSETPNLKIIQKIAAIRSVTKNYPDAIKFITRYNSALRSYDMNQYQLSHSKYYEEDLCLVPFVVSPMFVVSTAGVAVSVVMWMAVFLQMAAVNEEVAANTEILLHTETAAITFTELITYTGSNTEINSGVGGGGGE